MRLAKAQPDSFPGLKSVRFNLAARSVIIEYDARVIKPDLLEELATTRDDERADAIAEELCSGLMKNQR
jgi:hypothetical protein